MRARDNVVGEMRPGTSEMAAKYSTMAKMGGEMELELY